MAAWIPPHGISGRKLGRILPDFAACLGVQKVGVSAPIPLGGALVCLLALGLWDAPGVGAFFSGCLHFAFLCLFWHYSLCWGLCVSGSLRFSLIGLFSEARSFLFLHWWFS